MSTYFLALNRNKRSLTVDFKNPHGIEIVKLLVEKSDVVVENFVPGKLDELGLGYDALSQLNPKLVYCSISGFGNSGPEMHRPGYDVMVAAFGGLMSITGSFQDLPSLIYLLSWSFFGCRFHNHTSLLTVRTT
jgi:succinate--hydroxymethylglutarate CoA-transferase